MAEIDPDLAERAKRLEEALRRIKAYVVGEAIPNWDGLAVTRSRCYIADECDTALASKDKRSA